MMVNDCEKNPCWVNINWVRIVKKTPDGLWI